MTEVMRLAIVMPPCTTLPPEDAVTQWTTVTATVTALARRGDVMPVVHGRHATAAADVVRDGVLFRFHTSDSSLVAAIRADQPHSVHLHGLGWTRLLWRLRGVGAPVVVQHHGEPVFHGRAKWGHRLVRSSVAAYLFTGADHGQAEPWIDAGVIAADARVHDVLEAASMLSAYRGVPVQLEGSPSVLWVGRLVPGKDPLTAVRALRLLTAERPDAHLHLLATDRDMEDVVHREVRSLGEIGHRVHLHARVPHDAMAGWYSAADVFLSTSHHEGSGYSLIEAMACGCPPVVTAIPPHRSIVGDVGTTFAVGDAAAAARAIALAASIPRDEVLQRSRNVHSWERVADRLVEVHRSLP